MIFMQRVTLLLGLSVIPFGLAAADDDDPLPEGAVPKWIDKTGSNGGLPLAKTSDSFHWAA
jgi:hypothetical protein